MSKWIKFKKTTQPPPVILLDCMAKSFQKYFTKDHDERTKINNYGQFLGARWFGKEDFKNYIQMLKKSTPPTLLCWSKLYIEKKTRLLKFSAKISNLDCKKISTNSLTKLFSQYINLCARTYHYAYDYVILNTFYPEKINSIILNYTKDTNILNKYLPYLASVTKPTDTHKSQKELGELALDVKNNGFNSRIKQRIKKYVKNYGYLNTFAYFGEPITEKDVKNNITDLAKKSKKEIIKQTISKFDQLSKNANKTKEFIKNYKLKGADKTAIIVLQEYIYTSLWADELYHKVPYMVKPMFNEICRQRNLSYKQLIYMTADEIKKALSGNINKKLINTINKRIKDFAFIYEKGKTRVLTDKAIKVKFASELRAEKIIIQLKEIKGISTYPGRITGVVSTIKHLNDIKNFKPNKILVTTSTAPSHIPAISKASAIITDEGGLLSHAAIVSREFKIPCVIGTKIATQILKDGDMVRVDANKGIIKILK